jgi:hypothetical protein
VFETCSVNKKNCCIDGWIFVPLLFILKQQAANNRVTLVLLHVLPFVISINDSSVCGFATPTLLILQYIRSQGGETKPVDYKHHYNLNNLCHHLTPSHHKLRQSCLHKPIPKGRISTSLKVVTTQNSNGRGYSVPANDKDWYFRDNSLIKFYILLFSSSRVMNLNICIDFKVLYWFFVIFP